MATRTESPQRVPPRDPLGEVRADSTLRFRQAQTDQLNAFKRLFEEQKQMIESLVKENTSLRGRMETLESKQKTSETALKQELQTKDTASQTKIRDLEKINASYKSRIESLESQIQDLNRRLGNHNHLYWRHHGDSNQFTSGSNFY